MNEFAKQSVDIKWNKKHRCMFLKYKFFFFFNFPIIKPFIFIKGADTLRKVVSLRSAYLRYPKPETAQGLLIFTLKSQVVKGVR